jgi:hypothetical protein
MKGIISSTPENKAKIRCAFLPEQKATVRPNCIYFQGLEYECQYAIDQEWYLKAKFDKNFTIPVKAMKNNVDSIWHKTPDGQYIELTLKNVNSESRYSGLHSEIALQLQEYIAKKRHDQKQDTRVRKAKYKDEMEQIDTEMSAITKGLPDNNRKSMQPGVNQRKEDGSKSIKKQLADQARETFGSNVNENVESEKLIDLEDIF